MASGREISLEIIAGVLEKKRFYKDEYDRLIKKYEPDAREKSFIANLSVGTIERCIELDYIIGLFSSKSVDRLKPYIRNILRMSVFQMKYMRVPDNAAVNEAVKLAVRKGYSGLRGFVNGVLRNIAKDIDGIQYPDRDDSFEKYLQVRYSMPEWIVKHFLGENES